MHEIHKVPCECGKHDFVFPQKPWTDTEVKCSECGKLWMIKGEAPEVEPSAVVKVLGAKQNKSPVQ